MARPPRLMNGRVAPLSDYRTAMIIKRFFYKSLHEGGVDSEGVLQHFEVDLGSRSEEDVRTIESASDKLLEITSNNQELNIQSSVQQFSEKEWEITDANVHIEFTRVSTKTFEDQVNWGRLVAFLSFAVAFAAYVHLRLGMPSATVHSIYGWTVQVVQENLGRYFIENNGWVSMDVVYDSLHAYMYMHCTFVHIYCGAVVIEIQQVI